MRLEGSRPAAHTNYVQRFCPHIGHGSLNAQALPVCPSGPIRLVGNSTMQIEIMCCALQAALTGAEARREGALERLTRAHEAERQLRHDIGGLRTAMEQGLRECRRASHWMDAALSMSLAPPVDPIWFCSAASPLCSVPI